MMGYWGRCGGRTSRNSSFPATLFYPDNGPQVLTYVDTYASGDRLLCFITVLWTKGGRGDTETGCGCILEQCDLEGLVTCADDVVRPGGSKAETHRSRVLFG